MAVEPEATQQEVSLSRDMGLLDITMIGVGGMIEAGIFVLMPIAAGVAGPAQILAFALNSLIQYNQPPEPFRPSLIILRIGGIMYANLKRQPE